MAQRSHFRASLRLRLTLWLVAIALSIHVALASLVLLYQRIGIDNYLDTSLAARANTIAASMQSDRLDVDDEEASRLGREALRFVAFDNILVALYAPDGELLASNARGDAPRFERVRAILGSAKRVTVHGDGFPPLVDEPATETNSRGIVIRLLQPGRGTCTLFVAATDDVARQLTSLIFWVLALTVPAGVLAAAVAGWVVAGIATKPLRELGEFASSLMPEHLDRPVHLHAASPEVADLERKVEDARSRLQAAIQSQDRFISNVSHELKTPVAVLLAEAQTLQRDQLSGPQRKFVESVIDEMRRLSRMVDSFLRLTRAGAGKGGVLTARCNLNDVVMESVASCRTMSLASRVELEPHLPELDQDPTVRGDAELLRVLLDNLIRNAIRFSPSGGRVRILLRDEFGRYAIRVQDDGPGIPEDVIHHIFDRFTQSSAEATRGRGYGIGLSIAQGIAELHGGLIRVRNLPAAGCEFEVSIPHTRTDPGLRLT